MTRLWRVRDRASFVALRRDGVRRRVAALTIVHLPVEAGGSPVPAVAFAIGRGVGPAVDRNRIRRRIKAIIAQSDVAPGTYLVSAGRSVLRLSDQDLRAQVADALTPRTALA
jgi:ribonuclease P protein component